MWSTQDVMALNLLSVMTGFVAEEETTSIS
jgi:hypothetical protein